MVAIVSTTDTLRILTSRIAGSLLRNRHFLKTLFIINFTEKINCMIKIDLFYLGLVYLKLIIKAKFEIILSYIFKMKKINHFSFLSCIETVSVSSFSSGLGSF